MSLQDDLTAVRRNLNELVRSVEQLEKDVARQAPAAPKPPGPAGMVTVPDTPYDSSLWTDSDDEGLGARDRRAP
ncbi:MULTISPECIES: hypothetical protein [unclassified Streptomyces]|uniref:hypothetical protein n=1 Tax=unclassified Streptomyces TaxID=2593676 RepID=UPI001BEC5A17|nr:MULTISPECIES: hypothetical protein [unclassified Streptomyces]MBT2403033.1 hypothetical protein [Streptomyces sp. ISL-21]MBT2456542.1 hypothetical protein [Streptomyces sp. ISL-86]MBT2609686.1 hypothetical protein [Streptomyces sp. ISL-87]MCX4527866.1 hypothetical protein [Streptomyces sp. NBC_01551]MCX4541536.1 hypothetical protein [Streptomyces sp. NBC_01565]